MYLIFQLAETTTTTTASKSENGDINTSSQNKGPTRLHVSNIPFRFREADLRALLGVSYLPLLSRFSHSNFHSHDADFTPTSNYF